MTTEVALYQETRQALVLNTGRRAEIEAAWGRHASLRFAHAVVDVAPAERVVKFSVGVRRGTRLREIHEVQITLPAGQGDRWHEADVPLPQDESRGTLVLRAERVQGPPGQVAWGSPRIVYPRKAGEVNVLLVSIDTLRADHLNCYGYAARTTTPRIDGWARTGTRFEWAISQAPWTTPSHMSLFTSLMPAAHGVDVPIKGEQRRLAGTIPTLAGLLRSKGVVTAAFTAGGPMGARFGFANGFDFYRERRPYHGRDLRRGLLSLESWLEAHRDDHFFVFFHTYEVHRPGHTRSSRSRVRRVNAPAPRMTAIFGTPIA